MPGVRKDLRILVVGLGSMGRRRIRLLKGIDSRMTVAGVDLSADRCRQAEKECDIRTWADLPSALGDFNPAAVVVSTSPLSHGPIVMSCLKHGVHVFTELNLVKDWYKRAMRMSEKKGLQLFVSSTSSTGVNCSMWPGPCVARRSTTSTIPGNTFRIGIRGKATRTSLSRTSAQTPAARFWRLNSHG